MDHINGLKNLSTALLKFRKDASGTAIVEFALLTPVLLGIIAGIADFSTLLSQEKAMSSGVSSAAQYIMGGGSNLDAARLVGLAAWPSHAANATVTVSKLCYCNSVAGSCNTLCADSTLPKAYITVAASQPYDGWFMDTSMSAQQQVRIR